MLRALRTAGERPGPEERAVLARWHGWGAAPQLFDRTELARERERLRSLLGPSGYDAAARTTLNAHYTDPRIVAAMWEAVGALGIRAGVFLEPGSGRGSFLDAAPESFCGVGVELDPTTAEVAAALTDDRHRVIPADFGKLRLRPGTVDVVVGNVPFGDYGIFDPAFNAGLRWPIHDHFIIKSLAALAPGGVAVVLTSRYTLDKIDGLARRAMGERADFLGAVRLPSNAHEATAGTRVVTDVLVFRARAADAGASHAPGFLDPPRRLDKGDRALYVSAYFAEHPDQVLGEVRVGSGMYGLDDVVVESSAVPGDGLAEALGRVAALESPVLGPPVPAPFLAVRGVDHVFEQESVAEAPIGRIEQTSFGFRRYAPEGWEHHDPGKQASELSRLLEIRELARSLVDLEAVAPVGDEGVEQRRRELAVAYRSYVARHGPLNRVKINDETGRRSVPRLGGFRNDPDWPRVAALERYDESSGAARPAALLERRVVVPAEPVTHVETPADALSVSLAERGRVDLPLVAELLGIPEADCLETLGDLVYVEPGSERVVIAAEYLSGNVRRKLREATAAAEESPAFERNVAALVAVQPRDVTAGELEGVVGAPWVPVEMVTGFARHLAPQGAAVEQISVARSTSSNEWAVAAPRMVRERMGRGHAFGTASRDALELLECCLNGRTPVVTIETDDGRRLVDAEATAIACDRATELKEEFDRWLLRDDPERSVAMLAIYNEQFNSYVARSYAGMTIAPPGLSSDFHLRPHQTQAIARIVFGGNTALWHPVGAGKTAEMVVGGMEMRRLGIVRRPAYVVPNHMLEQFAGDFLRLYPAAEVLTVPKDEISPRERHLFAARARSHDWDAVIITHSSFVRWRLSAGAEADLLAEKVALRRAELAQLAGAEGAARTLTKRLEKAIARYEAKAEALQAKVASHQDEHDFPFDASGIDYVFVDEADEFKNGELYSMASNLRGVPVGEGSQRAVDLECKLRFMRGRYPERQATHATGTPVSNTVAELWIAIGYLRPDLLAEHGIESFDAFRAVFCDTTSDMELDLTRTFRRVERLSRYKNLPELARLLGEFADVVTVDALDLPRPGIEAGGRQVVAVPPSPELEEFIITEVRSRVEAIRSGGVEPTEDNMLKLSTECRLASFDWETFRGERVGEEHSILAAAARNIGRIYRANKDRVYLSEIGTPHPRPGALQLVFCDLGTAKPGRDDTAYDRLREMLVDEGVPRDQVRFIHEHDTTDEEKARFFAACRDGRVAVAIASTAKMGMGTNVQDRLVAGHHLDAPWRPRDVEQRKGRWDRQGNQNPVVAEWAYVTERSFSVYAWQTLERKAGFVGQILRADPDGPRALEVHDEEALSYAEVKAIATGDPAFLELARLEDAVGRLERTQRGHVREQAAAANRRQQLERRLAWVRGQREALGPAAGAIQAAQERSHPWRMEVDGRSFDNRGDAARAMAPLLGYGNQKVLRFPDSGVDVEWRPVQYGKGELVALVGTSDGAVKVDDRHHDTLVGALTRLTNAVEGLPHRLVSLDDEAADVELQLEQAAGAGAGEFPKAEELRETRRMVEALRRELAERYGDDRSPGEATPAEGAQIPAERSADGKEHVDALRAELAEVTGRSDVVGDRHDADGPTPPGWGIDADDELAGVAAGDAGPERSVAGYLSRQPSGSEARHLEPGAGPDPGPAGYIAPPGIGLE